MKAALTSCSRGRNAKMRSSTIGDQSRASGSLSTAAMTTSVCTVMPNQVDGRHSSAGTQANSRNQCRFAIEFSTSKPPMGRVTTVLLTTSRTILFGIAPDVACQTTNRIRP